MKKWKPWFAAKPLGTWQLFNGSNLVQTWFKHVHLVEVMVNLEIKEPKGNRRNNYKKEKRKTRRKRNDTTKNIFILRAQLTNISKKPSVPACLFSFSSAFYPLRVPFLFPLSALKRFAAPHQRSLKQAWTQFALHSTLYALRSTLHTLHLTLYTPHPRLHSLRFALHTLRHTLHSRLHTLDSRLYTQHSTLHTLHSTLYTPHSALHTLHFTLYTPHFALHTRHTALLTL